MNETAVEPFSNFAASLANVSEYWTPGNGTLFVGRNSVDSVQESLVSTVFKVLAYAVVMALSLIGNSLVIGSVYQNRNRRMRTVSNNLIVNLCIADLLITVCNIPRMISIELVGFEWLVGGTFGLFTCKINSSVPFISVFVSTLSFAVIALDRFLAVFFPLRRPMTGKIMAGIIIFTWILPCCCYYLLFHHAVLVDVNDKIYCGNAMVRDLFKTTENYHTYLILDFIITSGIPIATVIALYTAISMKMCTRKTIGNPTPSGMARNRAINRKVISMLATVVFIFCICWMPAWVAVGACLDVAPPRFCNSDGFVFIRYFLSYSNSAITPYIYPVFNQNFRSAFMDILRPICFRCPCGKFCSRPSSSQELRLRERTPTVISRMEAPHSGQNNY